MARCMKKNAPQDKDLPIAPLGVHPSRDAVFVSASTRRETVEELSSTVLKGGYCVGCGACSVPDGSPFAMALNRDGQYEAVPRFEPGYLSSLPVVCPFSGQATDEDALSRVFLPDATTSDALLGRYLSMRVGHVAVDDYRTKGSSGGFGSWIAISLLASGLVDAVAHSGPTEAAPDGETLYSYRVSRTAEEVRGGSKSHYYPVQMGDVLQQIRATEGRFAIIGIPCFIKAVRLLAASDPILRQRIRYCIGLFCGHLKSTGFAELLGWQLGVRPENLGAIDFRTKLEGRRVEDYGVTATGRASGGCVPTSSSRPKSELFGTDWGLGLFKYKACDYCDDFSAETADVAIGDAWLPRYSAEYRGTNVVIVRSREIEEIVQEGMRTGALDLSEISADDVHASQSGNVNHRRDGLSYRLAMDDLRRTWRPRKRVAARFRVRDGKFRRAQRDRITLREASHEQWHIAKARGELEHFDAVMRPMAEMYNARYHGTAGPGLRSRLSSLMRRHGASRRLLDKLRLLKRTYT